MPVKSEHKTGGCGSRISRPQKDAPTVQFIFSEKTHDVRENFVMGGRPLGSAIASHLLEEQEMKFFQIEITSNRISSLLIFWAPVDTYFQKYSDIKCAVHRKNLKYFLHTSLYIFVATRTNPYHYNRINLQNSKCKMILHLHPTQWFDNKRISQAFGICWR